MSFLNREIPMTTGWKVFIVVAFVGAGVGGYYAMDAYRKKKEAAAVTTVTPRGGLPKPINAVVPRNLVVSATGTPQKKNT